MDQLPSVVIVGRPNVGKSTLFNAIIGQRRSIVGDEPGITRDRIYGLAVHRGRRFELIDTGGIIVNDEEMIPSHILKQARVALEQAAQIIFLIDGRSEMTSADRDLSQMLRKLGKPVVLAVNKIDSAVRDSLAHEFHSLGFKNLFPVSAEHRLGLEDLLDNITEDFPKNEEETEEVVEDESLRPIKVSIIGRPNVGKSTLLNSLVGEERSIVSPVAGTTRDAVDETVEVDGRKFVFVDTAGIRRKGKTKLMAEKLSVVMARRNIRMAHVTLLIMDATEGVLSADATIAGYAHEEGRCVILVVNKWDATGNKDKKAFTQKIRDELKFLEYAPIAFISAKEKKGTEQLYGLIKMCYDSATKRVGTGELNRFVETMKIDQDMKINYITQASIRPPTFVMFTDARELHFSTERYVINRLREKFGFKGTPIFIKTKRR